MAAGATARGAPQVEKGRPGPADRLSDPAAISRAGVPGIESWLRDHKARLAGEVMGLDEQIAEISALIEARFREDPLAAVIVNLRGVGPVLGAQLVAANGGDMAAFGSAHRLAAFAGLAPAPRWKLGGQDRQTVRALARSSRSP
jgi:transposase